MQPTLRKGSIHNIEPHNRGQVQLADLFYWRCRCWCPCSRWTTRRPWWGSAWEGWRWWSRFSRRRSRWLRCPGSWRTSRRRGTSRRWPCWCPLSSGSMGCAATRSQTWRTKLEDPEAAASNRTYIKSESESFFLSLLVMYSISVRASQLHISIVWARKKETE